jgi:hypothetical protein
MKVRMMAMMVLAVVFCGIGASAAEGNPPMSSKRIKYVPEQVETFQTRNAFGQIHATFVGGSRTRVKLKIKRGYDENAIVEIPLFYFGAGPVFQYISYMAKIPETLTEYYNIQPGRRLLVHVDASTLPLGELKEWKNSGDLKGGFFPMNIPPKVEDFKGRRGVRFDPNWGKIAKPDHNTLAANFTVNDYLGYGAPFTFSAWVYSENDPTKVDPKTGEPKPAIGIESHTSMFTWGAVKGGQQTCLRLAQSDVAGMSWTPQGGPGGGKDWKLVTYTYTGGDDGVFTTYINGALFSEQKYDAKIKRLPVTDITATSATLNGELFTRDGQDGSVLAMYGQDDWYNWYQRRHVYWDFIDSLKTVKPGTFSHKLEGLFPGKTYYFRYGTVRGTAFPQSYGTMNTHRFTYGPGMFVTASEDGKTPGRIIPNDTRNAFFIGGDRGARWFMNSAGPSFVFDGLISEIKLYDYAMDFFEVRESLGMMNAYSPVPADGASFEDRKVTLSWKPALKETVSYRVFFGIDKQAVAGGTAKRYETKAPTLEIEDFPFGVPQYWRVEQLDASGKVLAGGDTWRFESLHGMCQTPLPADGATVNCNHALVWDPRAQIETPFLTRIYLEDSEEKLKKAVAEEKPYREEMGRYKSWKTFPTMEVMKPGSTMYWKVDLVIFEAEPKDGKRKNKYDKTGRVVNRVIRGPVWSFDVEDYFTPEVDTVYGKPPYDHDYRGPRGSGMRQCEERVGYRSRAVSVAPLKVLRDDMAQGISRVLYKQRKVSDSTIDGRGSKVGHWLDVTDPNRGIDSMAYGGLKQGPGRSDPNFYANYMTFHEFGHHMHGLAYAVPGFGKLMSKVYHNHINDNLGIGGYGGSNLGEDMAMGFHDMMESNARYKLYKNNRALYHLLRIVVAGDRYIDLAARSGAAVDGDGALTRWNNAGGLIFYNSSPGVHTYDYVPGTRGAFTPVGGPIQSVQSGSVPAFRFNGDAALLWNERTQRALQDNRDFSAQFWVKATPGTPKDAVIAALTGPDGKSFQFRWGDFPGAKEGEWQFLSFTYEGGGTTGEEAGRLRIFVGETEVSATNRKFDLPHDAIVSIGGWIKDAEAPAVADGFRGDVSHLRIYSYDISEDQVEEYFREEAPLYARAMDEIAGKLYVDIDCRRYVDVPQDRHEPFYPENQRKPWLRSWPNLGALGGRMHNDIDTRWGYSGSTPMLNTVDGAMVPVFAGKDRMVSGFKPTPEMVKTPPRTLEVWIERNKNISRFKDSHQVALEWGQFELTDGMLDDMGVEPDGSWHHVVLVFPEPKGTLPPRTLNFPEYEEARGSYEIQSDALKEEIAATKKQIEAFDKVEQPPTKVYVDGKPTGELNTGLLMPGDFRRMHFGGHYDIVHWNWKYMFHGAFASVRVHAGALSESQIRANAKKKPQDLPNPEPELIFEVNADKLPEGKLDKWDFAGSGGGTFVEGAPEKKALPVVEEFNGKVGLKVGLLQSLQSSFKSPESINGGPFTVVAHFALEVNVQRLPFLFWDNKSFLHPTIDMYPKGTIFRGQRIHPKRPDRLAGYSMQHPKPIWDPEMGARKDSFWEPANFDPVPFMAWIWKTAAISSDGKHVRYIVDGKLVFEHEAKLMPYDPKAKHGSNGRYNEYVRLGGTTDGRQLGGNKGFLNKIQVYDRAFSLKEIEARTKVHSPRDLPGKPIIAVDFGGLKPDTGVERIKNTGTLGGEFLSDEAHEALFKQEDVDRRPTVKTVDGVRVVSFDGENEFMKSQKGYPKPVGASYPFTFEALVKVPPNGKGSLLGLGSRGGFSLGNGQLKVDGMRRSTREGPYRRGAARPAASQEEQWKHLVYVFEGQRKPSHVYVDGEKVGENYFSAWYVPAAELMTLGKGFGGDIARLRMWRGIMSEEEIGKLAKEAITKAATK